MAITQQDFDNVKAELAHANTGVGSLTSGLAIVTEKLEKLTGDKVSDQVVRLVDSGAIWHCECGSRDLINACIEIIPKEPQI